MQLFSSKHQSRIKHRGYSLVELSMVMGIVAVSTAAFLTVFSSSSVQQQVDNTVIEVSAIETAAHGLFATTLNYAAITTAYIAANGNLPNADSNGSVITSPFHTAVTLAPHTAVVASDSFTIDFANVPANACVLMAVTNWGHYFVSMSVNGTVTTAALTPAQAKADCAALSQFNLYFY